MLRTIEVNFFDNQTDFNLGESLIVRSMVDWYVEGVHFCLSCLFSSSIDFTSRNGTAFKPTLVWL